MAALDFPVPQQVGDRYIPVGLQLVYTWNGKSWDASTLGDSDLWQLNNNIISPIVDGTNISTTGYVSAASFAATTGPSVFNGGILSTDIVLEGYLKHELYDITMPAGSGYKLNSSGEISSQSQNGGTLFSGYQKEVLTYRVQSDGTVEIGGSLPTSPNISLNSDGSATFKGNLLVENSADEFAKLEPAGVLKLETNQAAMSSASAVQVTYQDIQNVSINYDGSATFAGNVLAGSTPYQGGGTGALLSSAGNIKAGRTVSTDKIFLGYTVGTTAETSSIAADGSATFSQGNIALNLDGSGHFAGGILDISNSGTLFTNNNNAYSYLLEATAQGGMFSLYPASTSPTIQLNGNTCLLYTSPSPRDRTRSRMPSSA